MVTWPLTKIAILRSSFKKSCVSYQYRRWHYTVSASTLQTSTVCSDETYNYMYSISGSIVSEAELLIIIACSELRKVLFLAPSVCGFMFVCEISWEPLNGFAPNSHGRCVWSLAQTNLKVKRQGHQGQKTAFFRGLCVACVW